MESHHVFYIIIGVIFVLVIVSTTLFSLIILLVLICHWRTKCRSILNLLTINSCITFLILMLAASIQTPFLFDHHEDLVRDRYTFFCRIRAFLFLFACLAKSSSHLIQAISRYFIVILYRYRCLLTYRTNIVLIITSWFFSLVVSAGMFISPVSYQYEPESRFCILTTKEFETSFPMTMIGFGIPGSIMVFLYSIILRHMTHPNRVQPNNNAIRNNKRDAKVLRNTLLLLSLATLGGTPYFISIAINRTNATPRPFYSLAILFIALSGVAETLAIFCMNKDVKTILYAKIGLVQRKEVQTIWIVPAQKVRANPTRGNVASSRTMT